MNDPTPKATAASDPAAVEREPLVCENTSNLPKLLSELGISLAITTYQAGKLILARADGDVLNTHFRSFRKPMGLATNGSRLVVGTAQEIVEHQHVSGVCEKLEPKGKHDACYVPRHKWITGNIDIHEMAIDAQGTLWFVNTRFSTLCTLDGRHSFVPRWRPDFIKGLGPEDRCHLNGLGLRDGKPRYVTALGESDADRGWRPNKANGGVLIDINSGKTLCRGLSMPHSPRWYADKLWVLESGKGSLETVDPETGRHETVVELPGFTRGMDFCGPLAFIGLSQVRETALFSGLPITERVQERKCGVWVVDLRTKKIAGFLRFTSGVHEIFAVQVLHRQRFPELLPLGEPLTDSAYVLSPEALKQVKAPSAAPEASPAPARTKPH